MSQEPKLSDYPRAGFVQQLLSSLGSDIIPIDDNMSLHDIVKEFPHLRQDVEEYIARQTTGDTAYVAYEMTHHAGSSREWAEKVIEQASVDNPLCAYYGGYYGGKIWSVFWMVRHCGSSFEWAKKVLSQVTPCDALYAVIDGLQFLKRKDSLNSVGK